MYLNLKLFVAIIIASSLSSERLLAATNDLINATTSEVAQLIKTIDSLVIIDVRTPGEHESSRLNGSINIDYYGPVFEESLRKLGRDGNYIVYCRTGNRSGSSLQVMKGLGFHNVYNMVGGIKRWIAEDREIVSK